MDAFQGGLQVWNLPSRTWKVCYWGGGNLRFASLGTLQVEHGQGPGERTGHGACSGCVAAVRLVWAALFQTPL